MKEHVTVPWKAHPWVTEGQKTVRFGVGIGDAPEAFAQLSLACPSVRERQQALDEAIQVVVGLWGESPFTFHGQYFQVQETNVWPGPVQQPHIPILIAGGGERVTLRQVARFTNRV